MTIPTTHSPPGPTLLEERILALDDAHVRLYYFGAIQTQRRYDGHVITFRKEFGEFAKLLHARPWAHILPPSLRREVRDVVHPPPPIEEQLTEGLLAGPMAAMEGLAKVHLTSAT